MLHGKDFWQNIVHAVRGGLFHPATSGVSQLTELLRRLGGMLDLPQDTRDRMAGDADPTEATRDRTKPAQEISRIVALTGPSMIAIDQIDTLISQSTSATGTPLDAAGAHLIDRVAVGLMDLRETMNRTVTVVSCQPHTWESIRDCAVKAAIERFRDEAHLGVVPSAAVAHALVGKRFTERFAQIGFSPPYPTWPIRPEAFDTAAHFTARKLFERIDRHLRSCVDKGEVTELGSLDDVVSAGRHRLAEQPAVELSAVDARFDELVDKADPRPALEKSSEDVWMPELL